VITFTQYKYTSFICSNPKLANRWKENKELCVAVVDTVSHPEIIMEEGAFLVDPWPFSEDNIGSCGLFYP
jgi:hypothetical protein